MNDYFPHLDVNLQGIKTLGDLISFTQAFPHERASEYGVARLIKARQAISERSVDTSKAFAERLHVGLVIAVILEKNGCDAMLVPECQHSEKSQGKQGPFTSPASVRPPSPNPRC